MYSPSLSIHYQIIVIPLEESRTHPRVPPVDPGPCIHAVGVLTHVGGDPSLGVLDADALLAHLGPALRADGALFGTPPLFVAFDARDVGAWEPITDRHAAHVAYVSIASWALSAVHEFSLTTHGFLAQSTRFDSIGAIDAHSTDRDVFASGWNDQTPSARFDVVAHGALHDITHSDSFVAPSFASLHVRACWCVRCELDEEMSLYVQQSRRLMCAQ